MIIFTNIIIITTIKMIIPTIIFLLCNYSQFYHRFFSQCRSSLTVVAHAWFPVHGRRHDELFVCCVFPFLSFCTYFARKLDEKFYERDSAAVNAEHIVLYIAGDGLCPSFFSPAASSFLVAQPCIFYYALMPSFQAINRRNCTVLSRDALPLAWLTSKHPTDDVYC